MLGFKTRVGHTDLSSQSAISQLAASASPGNVLEMQILQPHPRPIESKTWGQGPQ